MYECFYHPSIPQRKQVTCQLVPTYIILTKEEFERITTRKKSKIMSHIPKITLCFIGRRDKQFTVNNTLNFYKENYVLCMYFPLAFHGFRCILNL